MIFGSLGAIATLPIDRTGWSSKTGLNVVPPFAVLNNPPVPVPTKNWDGLPGTSAISLTRPPMLAGPIERQARARSCSVATGPASPAGGAAADLLFGPAVAGGGPGASRIRQVNGRTNRKTGNDGIDYPPASGE